MNDDHPKTSLKQCLNAPGGVTMAEAVERAELHLAYVGPKAVQSLVDSVVEIERLVAGAADDPTPEQRREIYTATNMVAGLGGMVGRDALGKVAYSLCHLLDETEPSWDREAVNLHLSAMRILRQPDAISAKATTELLDGLVGVRRVLARERERLPGSAA
ncbi:MAG: hypothetical protein JNM59_13765 [Hyphomonadaceae bacterium]|nr:hypothetical protein [Hyphomonadaceae bacterium]